MSFIFFKVILITISFRLHFWLFINFNPIKSKSVFECIDLFFFKQSQEALLKCEKVDVYNNCSVLSEIYFTSLVNDDSDLSRQHIFITIINNIFTNLQLIWNGCTGVRFPGNVLVRSRAMRILSHQRGRSVAWTVDRLVTSAMSFTSRYVTVNGYAAQPENICQL